MPGVIESTVIGLPHADFAGDAIDVVVCSKDASVDQTSVLQALDGQLTRFKLPIRVFVFDELPNNAMDEVQKNILRKIFVEAK